MIRRALTIAGSDSGGGAGIQADLKTFAALGVHGMSVITSITAQNTYEVRAVHDVPLDVIKAQFEAVVEDIGVDAAKTGMLSNSAIIELVASLISKYGVTLVVDPVMIAKSGAPLLREDAVDTLVRKLIPLATVITPNKPEAERLSGIKISSLEDAKVVAKELVEGLGAKAAVVKGGHMSGGESVDVLYYDGRFYEFRSPRIESRNTHGTGCSFSAAITAELAKGRSIPEAVKLAKEFITTAIMYGLPIGRGYGPVNPTAWQLIPAEKYNVLVELKNSVRVIEGSGKYVNPLIPETPSYIVMTLPKHYVRDVNAVAGTPIVRLWGSVKAVVEPEFGICREFGELLMKVMEFNNDVRALMSIKYDERLVDVVSRLGFKTLRIGLREALRKGELGMYGGELSKELDIIFDVGGWGLEPLTIVLGRNSLEVTEKVLKIGKEYSGGLKER